MDNRAVPLDSESALRDEQLAALLASPPPRRVPEALWRAARRQAPGWFFAAAGALAALLGIFLVGMFFPWKFYEDWRLAAADTVVATGRIVSVEPTTLKINKRRVFRYEFAFQLPAGGAVRGECYTTGQLWPGGGVVPVRYRAEQPALCCVEGARRSEGDATALIVLLFPALGVGFLVWVIGSRRRLRWLLENGAVAEVLVTAIEPTSTQVNRQPVYQITLQRTDAGVGPPFIVRKYQPAQVEFARQRLVSRQPVFILFNPARPKQMVMPEAWPDGRR
jgi:hypothetical protein